MKAASMERHGLCPKFKNFELVELLGHQAIHAKDFEFLSQLLKRNQRGSCGFRTIIDPQKYPFFIFLLLHTSYGFIF